MEQALVEADWSGFPARKAQAHACGKLAGIGLANHITGPVGAPFVQTTLRVLGEGVVEVIVGTQSTGQGHETSFAQVVADQLGVPFESIRILYGDTDIVSIGAGTHYERSLRIAGTLMVRASAEILEQARQAATVLFEVAPQDLIFEAGHYRVSGTDRTLSLFNIARALQAGEGPAELPRALQATSNFKGRIPAYPSGTAVCEIEIDPETGTTEITRHTAVDDVGQPINPMIVDGQTHGGIAQGVGQALLEGMVFDPESGQVLTGSFADYGICHADDLPPFTVAHAEDPTYNNPLRVKGGGEGGIMPATAAVMNALCDALTEVGINDLPMPATPEVLYKALRSRADFT